MQRSVLGVGLLAVVCVLSASSALAQFYNVQRSSWTGENDHFCGNTLISTSTSFNNAGSLIYTNSTLPTNTGPLFYTGQWSSGDYWWGIGVFDDGSDGVIINNTGTIQAVISGYGSAQAVGIGSLQVSTITNWGTIDAQVLNNDGEAMGVWADSGGTTLVNNGTISARSQFSTVGVNANNNLYLVNNGTIQSIADAGTQGISANQSFADGIGTGSGLDIPEYFENNGQIINICTSTTATNQARARSAMGKRCDSVQEFRLHLQCKLQSQRGGSAGILLRRSEQRPDFNQQRDDHQLLSGTMVMPCGLKTMATGATFT